MINHNPLWIGIQIEEPNTRNFALCIQYKVFISLSRQYFGNKCINLNHSQTCVFVLLFTFRKKIVEVGTCCLMPYIIFLFMFILCCVVYGIAVFLRYRSGFWFLNLNIYKVNCFKSLQSRKTSLLYENIS